MTVKSRAVFCAFAMGVLAVVPRLVADDGEDAALDTIAQIEVGRDGVEAVEFSDDGTCVIKYDNHDETAIKPRVSVFVLNRFGVIVGRADDVWKIKKLQPKDKVDSEKFPVGASDGARYVDVETAR